MLAIAKTAIHNRGINIIKESTSDSRQSLIKKDDGTYESLVVPLDSLPNPGSVDAFVSTSYLFVGIEGKQEDKFFDNFALNQLLNCDKLKPRQRRFLHLLLGKPDVDFSVFIGEDNVDAAHDWNFDRYLAKCCAFLKVPEPAGRKFLLSLRSMVEG
jgi:hypothetical protein